MNFRKHLIIGTLVLGLASCSNAPQNAKSLGNEVDSVSYAVGLSMSLQLKGSFKEVNRDLLLQGIRNGLDSTNLLISFKDNQKVIRPYFQRKQVALQKERQAKAIKDAELKFGDNKKAGEAFLVANKSKKGVKTTASGLQYQVIKEGKGATPKPTDQVKIHYHGTNIDGSVFDSTVEKKKPYTARANQFVPGFNEGLSMLKVGSKYRFFIPQELAYGYRSRGPKLKPFSTLIFEVELLEILNKK